ncbi:hypothetical protein LG277_02435 [Vreelandella aquamarina]|uniref:hypothetical protein n=1 Tax=Vreelandella aquamarina TaxID=77097 RepID=UPI00384B02F3
MAIASSNIRKPSLSVSLDRNCPCQTFSAVLERALAISAEMLPKVVVGQSHKPIVHEFITANNLLDNPCLSSQGQSGKRDSFQMDGKYRSSPIHGKLPAITIF